jgi:maleate isomerase
MLGKPVLTANQVTMCSALRSMGSQPMGTGQLLVEMARPTAA